MAPDPNRTFLSGILPTQDALLWREMQNLFEKQKRLMRLVLAMVHDRRLGFGGQYTYSPRLLLENSIDQGSHRLFGEKGYREGNERTGYFVPEIEKRRSKSP